MMKYNSLTKIKMHGSSSQITSQFLPPACHMSSKKNIKIWLKLKIHK